MDICDHGIGIRSNFLPSCSHTSSNDMMFANDDAFLSSLSSPLLSSLPFSSLSLQSRCVHVYCISNVKQMFLLLFSLRLIDDERPVVEEIYEEEGEEGKMRGKDGL